MSELKPCPFCGENVEVYKMTRLLGQDHPGFVRCDCVEGVSVARWNDRPIEDALRSELSDANKRLEDATGEIDHLKDTRQDPFDQIEVMRSELDRLREQVRWIPVSERLPKADTRVEIFSGFDQTIHIGHYREHATQWDSEDGCYWHGKNFGLITHWRPLPEPPEEK